MTLHRTCAITGAAEIAPRRTTPGQTTLGLIGRVGAAAVADAGLEPGDVDGLLVGPQVGETPQHVPATVAEYLGLTPRYGDVVDLGGASGPGMVWRAAAAIQAGMCDTVLCVLANTRDPAVTPRSPNRNPIREFDVPYGASGANQAYAMAAARHMHDFGTTAAQLASVPVFERRNAALNPDAVFSGKDITVEDVLASPMIAWPLRQLEIVMPCGGGAAVVVQRRERARGGGHRPVVLLGAGEKLTHRALSQAPDLTTTPLAAAIAAAYDMAGIGPGDLDVLSLYDCYSIMLALTLEDAGLCPKGAVGPWMADQDFSARGNLPLNTHGGQLACGQADLAGGMCHLVEAVRQLRGEAGARQVANAELALVTGNGATLGEEVALVIGADA
ncbi:thiolase family protein [Pseudonocardia kunmingensis]|uniref:Acetyl-CoA acetyltransferase n=1 Tax=Pseudonocardia kunmingensis TaxID=630975 RepID=A0A543C208_9PSEU|nr:thiolase family protein [Pseudonocardia kunmingensis]TQL91110.1 acetyl-CoA acetyltransferase [Pseudonocardia kunmingensis]